MFKKQEKAGREGVESMRSEKRCLFCGISITFILCWLIFLIGCGANELENHAFPLALGVEKTSDDDLEIYMAYPDLQDENAADNALSSDVFWKGKGSDLFEGKERMSANSNKNADFNHLKVLILDLAILEDTTKTEQLLHFFQEEQDAAWNTYVMLTEEPLDEIFSDDLDLPESLGIYLEDLLEEWEDVRQGGQVTVGTLMSQYYEKNETLCVPVLEISDAEEKPEISGFCVLAGLQPKGKLSLQEGEQMMLVQNSLKRYSFSMRDGTRFSMEQIQTERKIELVSDESGNSYPLLTVTVRGNSTVSALSWNTDQESVLQQGKQELADRLLTLLVTQQKNAGCDLANSFLLLAGQERSLWEQYEKSPEQYISDVRIRLFVE